MKGAFPMIVRLTLLIGLALVAFPATAQTQHPAPAATPQSDNPISRTLKTLYKHDKESILDAAEKMPETDYSFKPTPQAQSFREILLRMSDIQSALCSGLKGEPPPAAQSRQTKAEITQTLKDSYAICDAVFETLTDETLRQTVKVRNQERAKAIAFVGVVHNGAQHYGYLVAYLRLKGLVPLGKELQGRPEK
jgi:hypothetical protein